MLVNDVKVVPCNPGNKMKKVGHLDVDHVVWDSEQDQQAIIQSYAEQCKIENILARLAVGDPFALKSARGEGSYITKEQAELLEKDPVELNQHITDIYRNAYNKFSGKDNLSYNQYVEIMRSGNLKQLEAFMPKKEEEIHE